jgi:RNA polymerase sigma-70 factor, ECF subfamily
VKRSAGERGNEQERFKALMLPHLDALLGLAARRLGDPDLAQDLVQDTFLRAWQAFDGLDDLTRVRPWLTCILQRVISDHYRKHFRRQQLLPITQLEQNHDELLSSDEDTPFEALMARLSEERVDQALRLLPPEFADAIELHDIEGFKYREVAEIMETPLGTVMSRIARGRRLLAAIIQEDRGARLPNAPGGVRRESEI